MTDSWRVAVIHDYLTQRGGAERVVLTLQAAFPGARLLTSVLDAGGTFPRFGEIAVETTWLDRIPWFRRDPRRALPFLAWTFGRLQVQDVDVVLCSSSGWAHGVRTTAPKVVYCYTPPRWLYEVDDYVEKQSPVAQAAIGLLAPYLRRWDRRAAAGADRYLTTSTVVQQRIAQVYGINARVVPPPVMIDVTGPQTPLVGVEPGFHLVVGRARSYKNTGVVCEAFRELPDERLLVVGGLPEPERGQSWPANITGFVDLTDAQLRWAYAHCSAVVSLANEDFGLTPLEGNAFGKPAVVLRAGGFLDTLVEGVTGEYIDSVEAVSVVRAVRACRARVHDVGALQAHAARYSPETFAAALRAEVASALDEVTRARRLR
ncbi:MAG: glycosyltransferase [Pseudorhodobacter sp.]|nr:glycosyltransferase [Frankiaceae bacterium]